MGFTAKLSPKTLNWLLEWIERNKVPKKSIQTHLKLGFKVKTLLKYSKKIG